MGGKSHDTGEDPRAPDSGVLLSMGRISTWPDIFERILKTLVAGYLGKKVDRFSLAIDDPRTLKIGDILKMADYFNVDAAVLFEVICVYVGQKEGRVTAPVKITAPLR